MEEDDMPYPLKVAIVLLLLVALSVMAGTEDKKSVEETYELPAGSMALATDPAKGWVLFRWHDQCYLAHKYSRAAAIDPNTVVTARCPADQGGLGQ